MRRLQILILLSIFLIVSLSQAFAFQWPWGKKAEKPKTEERKAQGQIPQRVIPGKVAMPQQTAPKIVIPQIPKIAGAPKPEIPKIPEVPKPVIPNQRMRFGMDTGEVVSVNDKNPENIEIKIKTQSGEELTVQASPNIDVTRKIKVTDLKPGEKLMVNYMTDEEAKSNRAMHITAGEISRMNIPFPIPRQPAVSPKASQESQKTE